MIIHPVVGPGFSKKVLAMILGREIGTLSVAAQKAYPGENTDRHGIRLDVCLARGMEYGALRNVVVIFITTYDPFGLNRMVYTISNKCEEVPDMPYDDGAKTLFLYTKGTEGNPPEELRQLLHYMEEPVLRMP